MNSMFQKNLVELTKYYTVEDIAEKTGFSVQKVQEFLTVVQEPYLPFLVALKDGYGIGLDEMMFSELKDIEPHVFDRFIGNYLIYYFNNDSYKGSVLEELENTLNYGVLSLYRDKDRVRAVAVFTKQRVEALAFLTKINHGAGGVLPYYEEFRSFYVGTFSASSQNIFIDLSNKENGDKCSIILNNPPTKRRYLGGAGAVNSVARGREHNPCIQFLILTQRELDVPDGEIYNLLHFNDFSVDMDDQVVDVIKLFKRLYLEKNSLATDLTDTQKKALIQNKMEYHFGELIAANFYRFAKVSNRDDDTIYKLIKEGKDV